MLNLFKQSIWRAGKTKSFILASLIVGMMAVPCSIFAQIGGGGYILDSIADSSPTSWTLKVEFQLQLLFGFHDFNVNVVNAPSGFQPFNIWVESVTNAPQSQLPPPGLSVSFAPHTQNGTFGAFKIPNVTLLPVGTTVIPQVAGNVNTIAGFSDPALVTVTRTDATSTSLMTVEVTFSNPDPFATTINLINLWNTQGGNGMIAKLNSIQTKIGISNWGSACNDLNAFINQVNAKIGNGQLTTAQGLQLLQLAGSIKSLIVGC